MSVSRCVVFLVTATLWLAPASYAQGGASPRAPLSAYFDAGSERTMQQIIDSAAASGVPAGILVDKAIEGARKGVPAQRVVTVLRLYAQHLTVARGALGSDAGREAYEAAASAMLAGVDVGVVRHLARGRSGRALVLPLVVVTDLTLRGVSPDSAGTYVARLLDAAAVDGDLSELQQSVARGIAAGRRPAEAASNATEGALHRLAQRPPVRAVPRDAGGGPPPVVRP